MMFKKFFTPTEASRRLPLVKRIVTEILEKGKTFRQLAQKFKGKELPKECLILEAEVEALMGELEELGCYFKDWNFEIGLVDFPSKINDQNVFLCWCSDESNIRWYHSIEDGYPGRRLIPENLLEI